MAGLQCAVYYIYLSGRNERFTIILFCIVYGLKLDVIIGYRQ